jgi:16S rRNA (uracil1498-N3)-methyltransferase
VPRDRRQANPAGDDRPRPEGQGFSPRFFLEPAHRPVAVSGCGTSGGGSDGSVVVPTLGGLLTLGPDDSHHGLKVLRLREGDRCEVVTSSREAFEAIITSTAGPLQLKIVGPLAGGKAGAVYRHEVGLVQAYTRPAVVDHAVEKATEVGADFFLILPAAGPSRHAERPRPDRVERWQRIAREAAKQSKQMRVPWVEGVASVSDALACMWDLGAAAVVLDPGADLPLVEVMHSVRARWCDARSGQASVGPVLVAADTPDSSVAVPAEAAGIAVRVCLLVGPEGGWTEADLEVFALAGVDIARLGRSILRTETAGPVAVALARLTLDDW